MKNKKMRPGLCLETGKDGRCANCSALMWEYTFKLDVLSVILLTAMGEAVRTRLRVERMDFTVANQIHVPSLSVSHAVKCRTTQCAKLGLVAKIHGKASRGVWAITKRGFAALRGEPVPSEVSVFRNEITERYEEMITFAEAKRVHAEAVESAILRGKDPTRDHRKDLEGYREEEWYGFRIYE